METKTTAWHPFTQMKHHPGFPSVREARGARLILEDGRTVIDAISSWWVTLHGHCEPTIVEAIHRQAGTLDQVIFANFTHSPAEQLCQALTALLPGSLDHPFFSDNGSTAVEVALKIAYQYWRNQGNNKRRRFLAFEGAYHGDTIGALSVADRGIFSEAFEPLLFDVDRAPYGGEIAEIRALLARQECAAVIVEPLVQGAGGMKMCSHEWLQDLRKACSETGTLLIFDEVMTGFGRTGELFACLKAGVEPDLICLSKGITGGFLPLSVTVANTAIYEQFLSHDPSHTFWHGHSYTANPIACAAALASLELLTGKQAFRSLEARHLRGLEPFLDHPRVHNVRVCGTIAAFDVEGEEGYLAEVGPLIRASALERGVLIRPLGNVVYLLPPYCISDAELAKVYDTLLEIL